MRPPMSLPNRKGVSDDDPLEYPKGEGGEGQRHCRNDVLFF